MSQDRVRVTFRVDPDTKAVTRDGVLVDLGPATAVDAGDGEARTLNDIVEAYARAQQFSDISADFPIEVQLAVGEVLYRALDADRFVDWPCRWLEVVIEAAERSGDGTFLDRLPWMLTARPDAESRGFLGQVEGEPWVITIDGAPGAAKEDRLFPPEPRLLLMLPATFGDTESGEHEADIRQLLGSCYTSGSLAANVRTARTWAEAYVILRKDSGFNPHVVYFYGHGDSTQSESTFLFDSERGRLSSISAKQIGDVLGALPARSRPAVFFGNCCHGASAGRAGLREQLAAKVDCLIANRTVVDLQVARQFGLEVLGRLVGEASAPNRFMGEATSNITQGIGGSDVGGRWASPVVYTNYNRWIALAPARRQDLKRTTAGSFVERVDRVQPVGLAVAALTPLLDRKGIVLHALAWQAEAAQGVEAFGRRLRDEMYERFVTRAVTEFLVDLQDDTISSGDTNLQPQLLAAIHNALAEPSLRAIAPQPGTLKETILQLLQKYLTTTGVVLLIRNRPVSVEGPVSQKLVRSYWRLWGDLRGELARRARPDYGLRIVVAVALDVAPGRRIEIAELVQPPADASAEVADLGLLASVTVADLIQHFTDFSSAYDDVGSDNRDQKAAEIFDKTGGVFMPTQIALKAVAKLT